MAHEIDTAQIESFFNEHIYVEGFCAEVRVMRARVDERSRMIVRTDRRSTVVGWFTRADCLSSELLRIRGVSAYITFNPVKIQGRPEAAKNRLVVGRKGEFACADDIAFLRYVMIDVDPTRTHPPQTKNSTREQLDACREMVMQIVSEYGIGDCCETGTSGNGYFALAWLPDLPNNRDGRDKVRRIVESIASKYSTARCFVDPATFLPNQGVSIPGTWKFKDDSETPDRPYRMVTLDGNHAENQTDRSGRPVLATA